MSDKQVTISLIHPSRGRFKQAAEAHRRWVTRAGIDVHYILSVDTDDPQINEYRKMDPRVVYNKNRSAVDAINNAARVSHGDIFVVMSDDFDCPENWAVKLIEETRGKTDWVMKTQDKIQGWIMTLPIMDRAYYNRFGYVYHPDYLHMFCDTELTAVADLLGRKITSNLQFIHNHKARGTDATYERNDKTWNQGEKLFIERYKRNFDLVGFPGRITSQEYLNWIKGKI